MSARLSPLALAYHGIGDVCLRDDPHRLSVRPDDFRAQIRTLARWGYDFVTFTELARAAERGAAAGLVALTFDDGLADNFHTLLPILQAFDITASVFVVSGWLGGRHPCAPNARMLAGEEVRELHRAGVEIGAHTVTHPDLSQLSYEQALDELVRSRRDLERLLDVPVTAAAYPYGRAGQPAQEACRAAGFDAACRTSGQGSWRDAYDLPRQDMDNRCTLVGLRLKRDDQYETLMRLRAARAIREIGRRVRSRRQ